MVYVRHHARELGSGNSDLIVLSLQFPITPPLSSRMGMTLGVGSEVVWRMLAKEWVSTQPQRRAV